MNEDLAILAGDGQLPVLLDLEMPAATFVVFEGMPHQLQKKGLISAKFEKLGELFVTLKQLGIRRVLFAGSMSRPVLVSEEFDPFMKSVEVDLADMMKQGDDHLLGFIIGIFIQQGFGIVSAAKALPALLVPEGCVVDGWANHYIPDLCKADELLALTASVDIGQAVVVEAGMVLGLETLQGTDALLDFVGKTKKRLRNPKQKGILVKRPKIGQDLRVDIPVIGPQTIENIANAGLAGVVISPKSVLLIQRDALIERAKALGVFIQALEPIV